MPASPRTRPGRLGQLLVLLVTLFAAVGLAAQPATAATPTRVMLLGDSITGNNGCWRALLWQHLQSTGHTDVDFVGTRQNPWCEGEFDIDNEGHGGFLATGIANDNQLPGWLAETSPDIVMMMLGTNDVWSHLPPATILDAYTTLLGQMRAGNPDMKLIVAQILPMSPSGCTDCAPGVVNLNNAIPGWAAEHSTERSPITVVDQWTGFDTATDTTDGVHPNETTGIQKIESRWYPALTAALGDGGDPDDTQAPSVPGTPVASSVTASSVSLSWAAATDDVGVAGYDVVRVEGSAETQVAAATSPRTTVTGLSAGTEYGFAVYARDAAGNRSERSGTVVVTTEEQTAAGCAVTYRAVGDWGSGFQGEITIRNTGTAAVSGWSLGFSFADGQVINNMWGGVPAQEGGSVSVAPASYTSTIPAGGSVSLGFIASRGAANTAPAAFTLNGGTCTTS